MKYWKGDDILYTEGVRLWGVCPPKPLFVGGRRSITQPIYFAWKVLKPLLKERYDIIDCQNFPYFPCFSAKLHSILRKSKLVITWIEVWDNYWYEYLGWQGVFGYIIERFVAKLSKKQHIAISESTMRSLRALPMRGDITIVSCGIDLQQLGAVHISEMSCDIVAACRLIKEKNIDLLIRAVGLVHESVPGVKCLIIGDGPERPMLEKLTDELGLRQNVTFTGFLENSETVYSYFKSSRVFVLASTREGFGIVVLEANACGLPVITVNHPQNSAADLVMEGKTGFICQFNIDDLAAKILKALDSKATMSEDCINYSSQYDWNKIIDLVENVYNTALMGRKVHGNKA
jgi:glycosyltransferase involved in cell wall biosynthesis